MRSKGGIFPPFLIFTVFFPGGRPAPQMPLGLVHVQHCPDLPIQNRVALGQALLQVLMDRGFGNPELPGSGADGPPGLDHVHSQLLGPILHGTLHRLPSHTAVR